ncbi:MAG: VWA-like domain-containing protein [Lachnospiraceae bacterium]|nr:VWA-like domain-containing protein [Lachnospiraceae bacterium]
MSSRKYRRELTPSCRKDDTAKRAAERIRNVLGQIKRNYPLLIDAVNYLHPVEVEEFIPGICTDGQKLFYFPESVLREKTDTANMYSILHIIFHGLLGHFYKGNDYDQKQLSWDVMDLQVTRLFNEMGLASSVTNVSNLFEGQYGFSLYYNAQKDINLQKRIRGNISYLKKVFSGMLDDHSTWALPLLELRMSENTGSGGNGSGREITWIDITEVITGLGRIDMSNGLPREVENALFRAMRDAGMKTWGSASAGIKGEEIVPDEKGILSYRCLIEEASRMTETADEEDEIDPALYEYGLEIYGDIPLIEPLEHRFNRKLASVVVAVDTSGSCMDCLREFRTETVEIFSEIGEMGSMERLHYLECDADITFEKEYPDILEMEDEKNNPHCFAGFGGTDFNPVFDRIRKYEEDGERIDFLVYFSDGMGDYPSENPGYPVYYIFPDKQYIEWAEMFTPSWVRKMVLDKKGGA